VTRVLLASRNAKKLAELRRIVAAAGLGGIEIVGLDDLPPFPDAPETGATFEENALAKARDAVAATGLPSIADDSGIAVDALNGMPGVLSARWSGKHGDDQANLDLLLGQLSDVPDERRGGAFVCAVALALPGEDGRGGTEKVVRGEWRGTVIREERGANGFGYDPVFVPDGDDKTSAELAPEEKDARSHRGLALSLLVPHLRELL
jgi:XTP/dITP diphosphohydrolase